jgi:hypothetical protein
MIVVAIANSYTCDLLLRQAYLAEKTDYEDLAYSVGGEVWRVGFSRSMDVVPDNHESLMQNIVFESLLV